MIKDVNCILSGKPVKKMDEIVRHLSPSDIRILKFGPLVSCDV